MARSRIIATILSTLLLLSPFTLSSAQQRESAEQFFNEVKADHQWLIKHEHQREYQSSDAIRPLLSNPQAIDVEHYKLQIQLQPDQSRLAGTVTIIGKTIDAANSISIDAESNLTIDSVSLNGLGQNFQRSDNKFKLILPTPLSAASDFTIVVDYHGIAVSDEILGGGMLVDRHAGSIVMANLSEPYAAPTWWPCIDNPDDKATIETEITVPPSYSAASNGLLSNVVTNPDQSRTFYWREDYPLSTYLVNVATTNYTRFEDSYTALDGSTMPLVYYVYPEHLAQAQSKFAVTRQAIEIYAKLYGEYPFLKEKYGMVEFPWGGAMEHQTMTSMSDRIVGSANTARSVIVHELAHQWWGDNVTLKDFHDIWLNEGFATYSEALFFEQSSGYTIGEIMDQGYDDHDVNGFLSGSVYAEDLSNPFDDVGAIYNKGGFVLHMLRHLLGDEEFFKTLQDYRAQYQLANATTKDFQQVCEQHYRGSLDWFFQQWVYAAGRPIYKINSSISGSGNEYTIKLNIKQKQTQLIPDRQDNQANVFIMPIDITIHYADGSKETRTIFNDQRQQQFSFNVNKQPKRIGFDEQNWILKVVKGNS